MKDPTGSRAVPFLRIESERKRLFVSFLSVFLIGILAHGYAFANLTLSHDSLYELYLRGDMHYYAGSVTEWKISLGRFLCPVYRMVFPGAVGTPWLSGMLALVWVALAVYLVARMFSVDNVLILGLLGAVCTANVSFSALAATYISDLDSDMFAVFLAAYGAYLWYSRRGVRRWLAAVPFVLSLALYQAMISVAVSLIMMSCILRLLSREEIGGCKAVLRDGVQAIGILLLSGAAYYLLVRAVCGATGIELTGKYNGLSHLGEMRIGLVPAAVVSTYKVWLLGVLTQPAGWSRAVTYAAHLLLGVLFLAAVPGTVLRKKLPAGNVLLALALCALLPFAMNLSNFLSYAGMRAHTLMMYSFALVYPLDLLLLRQSAAERSDSRHISRCAAASLVLVAAIVWGNIQTANTLYLKKDLERQATVSQMTDVRIRLEQTEGYVPGETPVLFSGSPGGEAPEAFDRVSEITGAGMTSMAGSAGYAAYFEYVLQTPVCISKDPSVRNSPEIARMPVFPAEGSVAWIGDTLVVRMSE